MKITLEQTNGGNWLADCEGCGMFGVWPTRRSASVARTEHECGKPTTTPGKIGITFLIGPPAQGMHEIEGETDA